MSVFLRKIQIGQSPKQINKCGLFFDFPISSPSPSKFTLFFPFFSFYFNYEQLLDPTHIFFSFFLNLLTVIDLQINGGTALYGETQE